MARAVLVAVWLAGCSVAEAPAGVDGRLGNPEDTGVATVTDTGNGDTDDPTNQPANPQFRTALDGGNWQASGGGWYTDAIGDLRLMADLGDESVEILVLGQVIGGPGSFPVGFVSYYRYDDPISAIGTWDPLEDGGSMQIDIQTLGERLDARWTGKVQVTGYESDGSVATWAVGDGETKDWPGYPGR